MSFLSPSTFLLDWTNLHQPPLTHTLTSELLISTSINSTTHTIKLHHVHNLWPSLKGFHLSNRFARKRLFSALQHAAVPCVNKDAEPFSRCWAVCVSLYGFRTARPHRHMLLCRSRTSVRSLCHDKNNCKNRFNNKPAALHAGSGFHSLFGDVLLLFKAQNE